jgi:hypothetical protein
MGKDNKKRREEKKKKEQTRQDRKEKRRLESTLSDLTQLSSDELLQLFPRTDMESILGAPVEWKVYRTQAEVLSHGVEAYNTCVTSDMHYRFKGMPEERNPLHQHYMTYAERPEFGQRVGYVHNQVIIEGRTNGILCAALHLAGAFPGTLYMHDIELANPTAPVTRPLFPDQNYPGLGHGVFPKVIERLSAFARRRGFSAITASAADKARAAIFMRKGFRLDTRDPRLTEAAASFGHQIPLILPLVADEESP